MPIPPTNPTRTALLQRIETDPNRCGGQPCVRQFRLPIAVLLDGLAEGLSAAALLEHYPYLELEDVQATLLYAAELAREQVWRLGHEQ